MSDSRLKVHVVDDDPAARLFAIAELPDTEWAVSEFGSGSDCIEGLDQFPDVVLLDVEMPSIDGISVCRQIRESGNERTHVIFLSAHDDLPTRMNAYEAGGNDYLVKPYSSEELAHKLAVARRELLYSDSLSRQAEDAGRAAMSAITSIGEIGVVLEFLRTSFHCQDIRELAQALLDAVTQYQLEGLCEIRTGELATRLSVRGRCTPLEESVLSHASELDRIFEFHGRLVINYPQVTLLIPQLPPEDREKADRLKDHLAMLAESAQMRTQALASEHLRLAQAERILHAATGLTTALREIELAQERNRVLSLEIVSNFLFSLEEAFGHMELTETEEEKLLTLARSAMEQLGQIQGHGATIASRLRGVVAQLEASVAA